MDIFELLYETIDQMVWMYWLYNRERNTKIGDKSLFILRSLEVVICLCILNNDLYYTSFHFLLNQILITLFNIK